MTAEFSFFVVGGGFIRSDWCNLSFLYYLKVFEWIYTGEKCGCIFPQQFIMFTCTVWSIYHTSICYNTEPDI